MIHRFLSLCALALVPAVALAQTGKIQGRVTDDGGESLPGVNVLIEGTMQGTATDIDGNYVIIGVRPGTYTLVASYVGFNTQRVENVRVQIDLTTKIDFTLREESLMGEEVVITAERPLVQRDLTATTSVVGGAEIRAAPVDNLQEIVNLQAGVVNGHFRGGRLGEVGYWVDGLPVTDVYNGGLGVSVENTAVEELQVVTGAFNAEYGQALSGIVNIVTRDGDDTFSGSVNAWTGDYLSADTDLFLGIDDVSPTGVRNLEANFSGPVVPGKLWFFATGRYFGNDGYLQGQQVYRPEDIGYDDQGRLALLNPGGSGDSSLVSFNPYERLSGQFKLTWRALRNTRIAANVFWRQDDGRGAGYELLLIPDIRSYNRSTSRNAYAKITQTLSNRTFFDLGVTNTYTTFYDRLYDDPLDERYLDNSLTGFSSSAAHGRLSRRRHQQRALRALDEHVARQSRPDEPGRQRQPRQGRRRVATARAVVPRRVRGRHDAPQRARHARGGTEWPIHVPPRRGGGVRAGQDRAGQSGHQRRRADGLLRFQRPRFARPHRPRRCVSGAPPNGAGRKP